VGLPALSLGQLESQKGSSHSMEKGGGLPELVWGLRVESEVEVRFQRGWV